MIRCQECTKEISSNAVACPHCGCPHKKAERKFIRRWLFPLIVGLCTFSVLHQPFHNGLDKLVHLLPTAWQEPTEIFVDGCFHVVFSHTREQKDSSESNHEGGH